MPPPPSQRVGDKRRYYYYSSTPRHGGFNKGFQSLSSGPPIAQQPAVASPGSTTMGARHSRYDPHSPRKPMSRVGSRYNPDVDTGAVAKAPVVAATAAAAAAAATAAATAETAATATAAAAAVPATTATISSTGGTGATGGTGGTSVDVPMVNCSRYSGSRYNPQARPRSADSAQKETLTLNNANSASGYYSRNNKWRMGGGGSGTLDYDTYGGAQFWPPPFYNTRKRPPLPVPAKSMAEAAVAQHTPSPQQTPVPPRHQAQTETQGQPQVESQAEESQVGGEEPQVKEPQAKDSQVEESQVEESQVEESQVEESQVEESQVEESQVDRASEPKREPTPESKPEPKRELKPEPKSEPKSEPKFQVQPQYLPRPSPLPQPAATTTGTLSPTRPRSENGRSTTTEGTEGSASTEREYTLEQDKPAATNNNPHSLGASLINSVPQPTKKPEHEEYAEEDDKVEPLEKKPKQSPTAHFWSASQIGNEPTFREKFSSQADYEYVYDPQALRTDLEYLRSTDGIAKRPKYTRPVEEYVFPMTQAQTRLWELKNQPREQIIAHQGHLLRTPVRSLRSYPFVRQNIVMHNQALKSQLCNCISKLKRHEYLQKLRLKRALCEVEPQWQRECAKMDAMSHELHKEEILRREKEELELKERERQEKEFQERQAKLSGASRRRNRADFVDDAEMENVLLQIDPVYKHLQCAADIPPMILDPLQRNALKFKDVNNLVTNKDEWARRILHDGVDTFTEKEHKSFVEGYLSYPKKFLKISNHMGGLRSPEECVLHYYRTKISSDYKKLLNDKNKKRQKSNSTKRNRKRERASDTDNETSVTLPGHVDHDEKRKESSAELVEEDKEARSARHMEQVEIRLMQNRSKQMDGGVDESDYTETQQQQLISKENKEEEATDQKLEIVTGGENNWMYDGMSNPPLTGKAVGAMAAKPMPATPSHDAAGPASSPLENGNSSIVKAFTSSSDHRDTFTENYEISNDDGQQRKRQKHSGEHKSSYWSVKEATLFPDLLRQYGSQWSLISEKLGTKSTTMVRNYYQRNAAQFGWKPLVEEADFKRNATSSGSVQQSQILLQSEQSPLTMSTGVPSQLWPALGFFTNRNNDSGNGSNNSGNDNNRETTVSTASDQQPISLVAHVAEATTQPFTSNYGKEPVFPEVSSLVKELPAPRLPSIQLPASSEVKKEKPVQNGSHLKDILNDDHQIDINRPHSAWHRAVDDSSTHALPATKDHTELTSAVRPQISNLVAQELKSSNTIPPSNRRSSSLALLLNPENNRVTACKPSEPVLSQQQLVRTPAQSPESQPLSIQQQQPTLVSSASAPASKINFAMDPLGALAAVASESLLQTDKRNQSSAN